jgi:hypothetical protein
MYGDKRHLCERRHLCAAPHNPESLGSITAPTYGFRAPAFGRPRNDGHGLRNARSSMESDVTYAICVIYAERRHLWTRRREAHAQAPVRHWPHTGRCLRCTGGTCPRNRQRLALRAGKRLQKCVGFPRTHGCRLSGIRQMQRLFENLQGILFAACPVRNRHKRRTNDDRKGDIHSELPVPPHPVPLISRLFYMNVTIEMTSMASMRTTSSMRSRARCADDLHHHSRLVENGHLWNL